MRWCALAQPARALPGVVLQLDARGGQGPSEQRGRCGQTLHPERRQGENSSRLLGEIRAVCGRPPASPAGFRPRAGRSAARAGRRSGATGCATGETACPRRGCRRTYWNKAGPASSPCACSRRCRRPRRGVQPGALRGRQAVSASVVRRQRRQTGQRPRPRRSASAPCGPRWVRTRSPRAPGQTEKLAQRAQHHQARATGERHQAVRRRGVGESLVHHQPAAAAGEPSMPVEQAIAVEMHAGRVVEPHQHHHVAVVDRALDLLRVDRPWPALAPGVKACSA